MNRAETLRLNRGRPWHRLHRGIGEEPPDRCLKCGRHLVSAFSKDSGVCGPCSPHREKRASP